MNDIPFPPGQPWLDTDGQVIQAHGGSIMRHADRYWWYGENKAAPTYVNETVTSWDCRRHDVVGVSCYSSTDLYTWQNEGIVLMPVTDDIDHDLHVSKVMERPKVNFNPRTRQFVMHFHADRHDYTLAAVGVATSDRPTGPFLYRGTMRPNGADSRDLTVFVDVDWAAWLMHSSEFNKTLYL